MKTSKDSLRTLSSTFRSNVRSFYEGCLSTFTPQPAEDEDGDVEMKEVVSEPEKDSHAELTSSHHFIWQLLSREFQFRVESDKSRAKPIVILPEGDSMALIGEGKSKVIESRCSSGMYMLSSLPHSPSMFL